MGTLVKLIATTILAPFVLAYKVCEVAVKGFAAAFKSTKRESVHGDADFATLKQLKRAGNLDMRGFYVGRLKGKPVATNRERSLIVMAPPGTGKSQTIIAGIHALKLIPLEERPTLIVSDAANEVYRKTSSVLVGLGYDICNIDLVRPQDGSKHDILSFPRLSHIENDVRTMCNLIVPPNVQERQPHFRNFARQMLRDAIVLNIKYEGNGKTIGQIANEIIDDGERDKLIARMAKYPGEFAAIKTFEKLGKNEGPAMLSTALNHLEAWKLPNIAEASTFGTDVTGKVSRGWDWQKVFTHSKPVAVFVRTGLGNGGEEFARVLFGNAINTARRVWDNTEKPLHRPLRLIIDEAASLGHCVALTDAHNELRKANVTVMACFLSKASLDKTYGDDAATLWNGCDHLVFGDGKDMETYEAYSKMIGEKTIESESHSKGDHGQSEGKHLIARRVRKADEIRRLDETKCIAVLNRLVAECDKPYTLQKNRPPRYL